MTRKRRKQRKAPSLPGDTPTPEQIMRGEAVRDFVTHAETATKAMAHRVAHDPIEKWKRKGYLSDQEIQTIERMQAIWQAVHGEISITASYCEAVGGHFDALATLRPQERVLALQQALRAVEGHFQGLETWYNTFERVCRFGQHPLTCTGSRDRTLTIVQFVANIIATKGLV